MGWPPYRLFLCLSTNTPIRSSSRIGWVSGSSTLTVGFGFGAATNPLAARKTQFGSHYTVYCADWHDVAALLPREAAIVTDPPYRVGKRGFDYTKARRRLSHWDQNYVGLDQDFDPTPWLGFSELIVFGANHYWDRLPAGGAWVCWDKTPGQNPSDFASCEWVWLSQAGPPQYFPHL